MASKFSTLALALCLTPAVCLAGLKEMREDFDAYAPPALDDQSTPKKQLVANDKLNLEQLNEIKSQFEKHLQVSETYPGLPDDKIAKAKALSSDDAVAKMLGEGFTLQDLRALVLVKNKDVISKRYDVKASMEAFNQIEVLDTLLVNYAPQTQALMSPVGELQNPDEPGNKFPFPGILSFKGKVVGAEVEAKLQQLEIAKKNALSAASETYWNLYYFISAQEVMRQNLDLAQSIYQTAKANYEAGTGGYSEVLASMGEVHKITEELKNMEGEEENAKAQLAALAGLGSSSAIGRSAKEQPAFEILPQSELTALALKESKEIKYMRAMQNRMELMVAMTERMNNPGLSANYSLYERKETIAVGSEMAEPSFAESSKATMGDNLPKMPFYSLENSYLNEIRRKIEVSKVEIENEQTTLAAMIREAWFGHDKAKREEALYGKRLSEFSQNRLEYAFKSYSSGSLEFSDLLMNFRDILELNLSAQRSLADLGIFQARLEKLAGAQVVKTLIEKSGDQNVDR